MGGLLSVGCRNEAKNRWGVPGAASFVATAPTKGKLNGGNLPTREDKSPNLCHPFYPAEKAQGDNEFGVFKMSQLLQTGSHVFPPPDL